MPRDEWLRRTEWLDDASFNLLDRLQTAPWGVAPPGSARVRICYNKKEDLPGLARRRGASWYHYHGPEWQPFKDQHSLVDGMMIQESGTLVIGSLATNRQPLRFVFSLAALGGNLKLALIPPEGQGNAVLADVAAGQLLHIEGPSMNAAPGENKIVFKVLNPDPSRRLLFVDLADEGHRGALSAPMRQGP